MTLTPETLKSAFADCDEEILPPGSMTLEPASKVAAAHGDAWAADKALIKALVDAFGYRGYALDGFCKWVCQSCKAELVTTDTEGPEAMEHKAGCIVAPARGGEQT